MKKYSCVLLLALFAACHSNENNNVKLNADKNIAVVESSDEAVNKAIAKAKQTFGQFDTAFRNGHFDTSQFSIKVRFETNSGGEHIWTTGLVYKDGKYTGIVDEDAQATDKVKMGDKVEITMDNLSDWMYNDNGVLRGGYTIKAFRNKMNDKDKAAFDSSFYMKIVD